MNEYTIQKKILIYTFLCIGVIQLVFFGTVAAKHLRKPSENAATSTHAQHTPSSPLNDNATPLSPSASPSIPTSPPVPVPSTPSPNTASSASPSTAPKVPNTPPEPSPTPTPPAPAPPAPAPPAPVSPALSPPPTPITNTITTTETPNTTPLQNTLCTSSDSCADLSLKPILFTGNTALSKTRRIAHYSCKPESNQAGSEVWYILNIAQPGTLTAKLLHENHHPKTDVDLHLLQQPNAQGCIQRANNHIKQKLQPGQYWLVVDSWATEGLPAKEGPFTIIFAYHTEATP